MSHPTISREVGIMDHNPKEQVLVMSTACYSGGWCFTQYSGNVSNIHGASHNEVILSHPASKSIGQCCGSKFAGAVTESLCRMEFVDESESESEIDYTDTPSYDALTETIYDVLLQEIDGSPPASIPSFSMQDDSWGEAWREKTGFSLSTFRDKYNALRTVPVGEIGDDLGSASGAGISSHQFSRKSL